MIREIDASQLRVGMFIHKLDLSWIETPFWTSRKRLDADHDLRRIRELGCQRVWIDTAQGVDVPDAERVAGAASAAEAPTSDGGDSPHWSDLLIAPDLVPTSLKQELEAASRIRAKARDAMATIYDLARTGEPPDMATATPIVEDIARSLIRNRNAMVNLARLKDKDDYTFMHSVAVCTLMVALALELKLPEEEVRLAGLGGLLHDIGKMRMPPEILNKKGRLTSDEYDVMKEHPRVGSDILILASSAPDAAVDVCLHHHERVDGTGYPERLNDGRLSVLARMASVCDVYDAITSDRPYKQAWTPSVALHKMATWRKGAFDETVFQAFVRCVGVYPVGSLVRLASDQLAVVIEQSPTELLRPTVKAIYDAKARRRTAIPELIVLAAPDCRDRIVGREQPEHWPGLPALDGYWMTSSALSSVALSSGASTSATSVAR